MAINAINGISVSTSSTINGISGVDEVNGIEIAGGGGFTPPAGTFVWFKADELALSNSDPVSSWPDDSGAGNDAVQASGTLQPIYLTNLQNSLPGVRFDGSNDYLQSAAFGASETQPNTFHMVAAVKNTGADTYIADGNASGRHMVYFTQANSAMNAFAGGFLSGTAAAIGDTAAHQITVVFDGASSEVFVDGVSQGTGNVGSQTMDGVTLGATGDLGGFGQVDIFEILVSPGSRDTTTEDYLQAKWATP